MTAPLAASYGYDPAAFSGALGEAGLQNTRATPPGVQRSACAGDGCPDCGGRSHRLRPGGDGERPGGREISGGAPGWKFRFLFGRGAPVSQFPTSRPSSRRMEPLPYGGMSDPELYALCLKALESSGNYPALHEAVMESGQLCPPPLPDLCGFCHQRDGFGAAAGIGQRLPHLQQPPAGRCPLRMGGTGPDYAPGGDGSANGRRPAGGTGNANGGRMAGGTT